MNTIKLLSISVFCMLIFLCGCSSRLPVPPQTSWMQSGQITMSRPAPAISFAAMPQVFALLPQPAPKHAGAWLAIERDAKVVRLMEGDKELVASPAEGAASLPSGIFQLLHKQRSALWYAPDSYFQNRGLPLPPKNDKSRYRRGALGEYALFFERSIPIHNSPVWSNDVGGLRIAESDISRIYYSLEVGAPIEVR